MEFAHELMETSKHGEDIHHNVFRFASVVFSPADVAQEMKTALKTMLLVLGYYAVPLFILLYLRVQMTLSYRT